MSAPYSIGRTRYGVANVLSTTSGILCLCAIFATASISMMFEFGLPKVSIKIAFVFSCMAFSKAPSSSGSTNVVVIPDESGRVCAKRLYVPP